MALMRVGGTGGAYNATGGEILLSVYGTGDITISLNGIVGDITHSLPATDVEAHQMNLVLQSGDVIATGAANAANIDTEPGTAGGGGVSQVEVMGGYLRTN